MGIKKTINNVSNANKNAEELEKAKKTVKWQHVGLIGCSAIAVGALFANHKNRKENHVNRKKLLELQENSDLGDRLKEAEEKCAAFEAVMSKSNDNGDDADFMEVDKNNGD